MALSDPALSPSQHASFLDWHACSADEVAQRLAVDPTSGLSETEAQLRLNKHGPNRLRARPVKRGWERFAEQLIQPLVIVLMVAGTITAILGEWIDALVIFAVVLVNATIGYWQEAKAEDALLALAKELVMPVTVRRSGFHRRLPACDIVPGDVVLLVAGDRVPADLRLYEQCELQIDDAMLTGESLPVSKQTDTLPAENRLADRQNMVYAGTTVLAGQAIGLTVATGDATETGHIADLMASAPKLVTPLTRKMQAFSNGLLWMIAALALLTVGIGLIRGESAFDLFIAAVALAVGAIPEGLPAAVTVTLAIGVSRMAKRRAIIRYLPAVETLGCTTVICSDKTGTLTENAMTVRALWCAGLGYAVSGQGYRPKGEISSFPFTHSATGWPLEHPALSQAVDPTLHECLLAGVLCNDASLRQVAGEWQISGDPTEAALLVAARKASLDEASCRQRLPRLESLPFAASRQFMATRHDTGQGHVLYVKGAVERLLPRCIEQWSASGQGQLLDHAMVEKAAHAMAEQGLRVLLLARKNLPAGRLLNEGELAELSLIGLVGMIDPPRKAAISAIRHCHSAGIQVKMITGDHALTAQAIARQIGLSAERVLSGVELANLDEIELAAAVRSVDVFARVEPAQKLRLVRALQAQGEVVAMTGDGVNDAPALKQANIGIAMGLGGTEVAKEAAAMVLTDDNFASIEAAVEEGRGVWDNLIKFITWTLPTNFGEGLVIVAAIMLGTTLPITPLQILWINMTTAVLLGLPLAFEPIERGIMQRQPRRLEMPVLDKGLLQRVTLVSLLLLAGAFGLFLRAQAQGHTLAEARTVAVNVFVLVEMAYLFNCRSLQHGFWRQGVFSNPWIWAGCGCMLLLQLMLTYLPLMNSLFQTAPIGWQAWGEICIFALLSSLLIAGEKFLTRRGRST